MFDNPLGIASAVCAVLGLSLSVWGSYWSVSGSIVSDQEAAKLGVGYYASKEWRNNLELPPVRAIINQSRRTKQGLVWITVGTGLQILATVLALQS